MALDPVRMRNDAEEFYRMLYAGAPREAIERFVGDEYIQHNPLAGDGAQSLIDYFERMAVEYPEKSVEVKRSVCEGNLLTLHCRQVWPGEVYASFDCFRFDDEGKRAGRDPQHKLGTGDWSRFRNPDQRIGCLDAEADEQVRAVPVVDR